MSSPPARRLRTTPAFLILLTANLSALARAAELQTPADSNTQAETDTTLAEPAPSAGQAYPDGALIVPVDLSSRSDSRFVQQLLLSHGIEVDLGADQRFTAATYQALLASFGNSQAETSVPAIVQTAETRPQLSLAISSGRQLSSSRQLHAADNGISEWDVTWIEPHAYRSNQPSSNNIDSVRLVDELTEIQDTDDAAARLRARELGIDPDFVIDIERTPLPTEGLIDDGVASALLRRSEKTKVAHSRIANASDSDEYARLRKWLMQRNLEVNLDEACPFSREEILHIVEFAKGGGDVDIFLDLAIATTREDQDAGVSTEWQIMSFGCLSDSAEALHLDLGSPDDPPPTAPADLTASTPSTPPIASTSSAPSPSTPPTVSTSSAPSPSTPPTASTSSTPPTAPKPSEAPSSTPGPPIAPGPSPSAPTADQNFSNPGGLFSFGDEAPDGFDGLGGPITQIVDIYFNERKVGVTSVTVTVDELVFDDPLEALGFIDGLKNFDELLTAISQPLPTNAYLLCFGPDDPPGCGFADAEPLSIIYDESNLRLDLFLASDYQSTQSASSTRYLPPPKRQGTSILSLYSTFSRFANEDDAADLSARALLGYGFGNLTAEADYNSRTEQERLRQLKLTHYFSDYEFVLGTYPFHLNGGLSDLNLIGASFATSYKTRVDLENAFSAELVVYLTRRSIVQLLVDGRVYYADSYAAGNQAIDTASLPDGTYEVEIRILEADAEPRIEKRLFTKSTQIPPRGETVIEATAGLPVFHEDNTVFPEASDVPVLGFSLSNRLSDRSAFRLGLLQIDSRSLLQADVLYLGKAIAVQIGGTVGEDNTVSTSLSASMGTDKMSFSVAGNSFQSNVEDTDEVSEAVYGNEYEQFSASLNRNFSSFSLTARAGFRRDQRDDISNERDQYSLRIQRNLFRRKNLRAFIEAGWQQDGDDQRVSLQFNAHTGGRQWTSAATAAVFRTNDAQTDHLLSADANWQPPSESQNRYRFGAYANTRREIDAAGLRAELDSPWFSAGAATEWSQTEVGNRNQNSVATLSAHLGLDRRGAAMGGSDFAQSGLIVNVGGEPAGARFDIVLNGIKVGYGAIGSPQFIGLQPFETYKVKLIPQTVLSNGVGEDIYEFTLYPGSVQRIDITARREILLIATLTDLDGSLLQNAVIDRQPNPIVIDETGLIQAELSPGELITVRKADETLCQFTVPGENLIDEEVVVPAEPIVCQPIL